MLKATSRSCTRKDYTYGTDFSHVIMSSGNGSHKLTFENKNVTKSGSYMEPPVTEMLSLHMISGTRGGLSDPRCCLGLFGLAVYVAEKRTKEIGIRKVLGASVTTLWRMLSKDFIVLVVISCAVSIPLSYYFMNDWLTQYEYRTAVTWHVFGMACLGALFITILTVSYQAIKAALANPIHSLRSE